MSLGLTLKYVSTCGEMGCDTLSARSLPWHNLGGLQQGTSLLFACRQATVSAQTLLLQHPLGSTRLAAIAVV